MFLYCDNNPVNMKDVNGYWGIRNFFNRVASTVMSFVVLKAVQIQQTNNRIVNAVKDWGIKLTSRGTNKQVNNIVNKGTVKPYGNLSHASEYGIDTYKNLSKRLKGTGLQAHHIIQKRLADTIGFSDHALMKSVSVTPKEHQVFTNAWRQLIPYGTDYTTLSRDYVWSAAQKAYSSYPELLKAAKDTIFR